VLSPYKLPPPPSDFFLSKPPSPLFQPSWIAHINYSLLCWLFSYRSFQTTPRVAWRAMLPTSPLLPFLPYVPLPSQDLLPCFLRFQSTNISHSRLLIISGFFLGDNPFFLNFQRSSPLFFPTLSFMGFSFTPPFFFLRHFFLPPVSGNPRAVFVCAHSAGLCKLLFLPPPPSSRFDLDPPARPPLVDEDLQFFSS